MRFITWNCRVGGFRNKCERLAELRPDVLAVQELEPIDSVLLFAGQYQPTFKARASDPTTSRGVGLFSYTDTAIEIVDPTDAMCFRRYLVTKGTLQLQVVNVWTSVKDSVGVNYRQAHIGGQKHADWIRSKPTVILGDFNNNATFKRYGWRELIEHYSRLGLVSAYHKFFNEEFGKECRATHFHLGDPESPFHLDYCFLSTSLASQIESVSVGTHDEWQQHSDHMPLTVDIHDGL